MYKTRRSTSKTSSKSNPLIGKGISCQHLLLKNYHQHAKIFLSATHVPFIFWGGRLILHICPFYLTTYVHFFPCRLFFDYELTHSGWVTEGMKITKKRVNSIFWRTSARCKGKCERDIWWMGEGEGREGTESDRDGATAKALFRETMSKAHTKMKRDRKWERKENKCPFECLVRKEYGKWYEGLFEFCMSAHAWGWLDRFRWYYLWVCNVVGPEWCTHIFEQHFYLRKNHLKRYGVLAVFSLKKCCTGNGNLEDAICFTEKGWKIEVIWRCEGGDLVNFSINLWGVPDVRRGISLPLHHFFII